MNLDELFKKLGYTNEEYDVIKNHPTMRKMKLKHF